MRGRKPKPTTLKLLEGNRGHRPLNPAAEPSPPAGIPPKPAWLSVEAAGHYDRLATELARLGVLTTADGDALACLADALAGYEWCARQIAAEGRLIQVGTQRQPHPAASMQRHYWRQVLSGCALFGLDPSSRGRLKVPPPAVADQGVSGFARKRSG